MNDRESAVVSGVLPAAASLALIALVNAAEFFGLFGRFPGYGILGVFGLVVLGGVSVALALILTSVGHASKVTTVRLLAFGGVLLVGCVPLCLAFGCVFYGCAG